MNFSFSIELLIKLEAFVWDIQYRLNVRLMFDYIYMLVIVSTHTLIIDTINYSIYALIE